MFELLVIPFIKMYDRNNMIHCSTEITEISLYVLSHNKTTKLLITNKRTVLDILDITNIDVLLTANLKQPNKGIQNLQYHILNHELTHLVPTFYSQGNQSFYLQ